MKARSLLITAVLVLAPALMYATTCAAPAVVPADGRVVDFDFVAPSTSNFYQFNVTKGNSYSVEVRQDYDGVNTDLASAGGGGVTIFTDAGTCVAALTTLTNTTANDPALPANSFRSSFIAANSGTYTIQVQDGSASNGRYVSVSVSDTTIYCARWSTFSGFITQWGFKNTTGASVSITMTLTDTLGSPTVVIPPQTFSVAGNAEVFKIVGQTGAGIDFGVSGGHGGYAVMAHLGPPGSILADAYFIGSAGIVPSTIRPVREGH